MANKDPFTIVYLKSPSEKKNSFCLKKTGLSHDVNRFQNTSMKRLNLPNLTNNNNNNNIIFIQVKLVQQQCAVINQGSV